MSKKPKKHFQSSSEETATIKNPHEKEEKHDWFIEYSHLFVDYLSKYKRTVIQGIMACCAIILIIILIVFLLENRDNNDSNNYYDINNKLTKLLTVNDVSEKNKLKNTIEEDYRKLSLGSSSESHLSQFNLGVFLYSNENYNDATAHFRKASKENSFPFAFQATYNLGNTFFNIGFIHQKEKKWNNAIESYKAAYKSYENAEKDFPDAPIIPLTFRYRGLVKEYIALCRQKLNQNDQAKISLEQSIVEYKKLLKYANKESSNYNFTEKLKNHANLSIRRVENKLLKFKK